jgi:hypothetical protein
MTIPDACQLTWKGQQHLKSLGGDASSFDAALPDKKLESICNRLGIEFIRGSSFLDVSCYKTNDCHWNEKGHRVLAKRLVRLYTEATTKARPRELEVMRA